MVDCHSRRRRQRRRTFEASSASCSRLICLPSRPSHAMQAANTIQRSSRLKAGGALHATPASCSASEILQSGKIRCPGIGLDNPPELCRMFEISLNGGGWRRRSYIVETSSRGIRRHNAPIMKKAPCVRPTGSAGPAQAAFSAAPTHPARHFAEGGAQRQGLLFVSVECKSIFQGRRKLWV